MKASGITAFAVACMISFNLLPLTAFSEENAPHDRGDGILENTGDWLVSEGEDVSHTDETLVINGNITINGTLSLTRCLLIMNLSGSAISVNGELNLDETNISGNSTEYFFIVNGTLRSVNSHFTAIAGSTFPFVGGLQVYSENVFIEGGSITNSSYAGLYITTNITLRNLTIENNEVNVVIEGASPYFLDCYLRYANTDSVFLFNRASPYFIGGEHGTINRYDDNVSYSHAHRLSIHVIFDNGTSIPEVNITVDSFGRYIVRNEITDSDGWIRNIILPEETIFANSNDRIYTPYLICAEKYNLKIVKSVHLTSDMEIEIVLTGDYFGEELARGDFNGDGLVDLAVNAPGYDDSLMMPGTIFIYMNEGDLEFQGINESMATFNLVGQDGNGYGHVLASGDINGDGFDDLMIAAPQSSANGTNSGRVDFYFGSDPVVWEQDSPSFQLNGAPISSFGKELYCGNLNNDVFHDVVICDRYKSHIYYGSSDPGEGFTSLGPDHSLEYGNISSGDINGDGFPDLLISDSGKQILYFGASGGLNPPRRLNEKEFSGSFNNTRVSQGILVLDRIGGPVNGNFDAGWANWTLTSNIRNKNNGQWEVTVQPHGDWLVHNGPTASLGPEGSDYVATKFQDASKCDGKLISEPFYIPTDFTHLEFWHHAKWWDFEEANGSQYQDEIADAIILRLVDSENGTTICERNYNETNYLTDGEMEGKIQFNITDHQDQWMRFEMELITNYQYYEDGLVQVDDIYLFPERYHEKGAYISDWFNFEDDISHILVQWEEELNNGSISLNFRTDPDDDWSTIENYNNGAFIPLVNSTDTLQYKVEMENNGSRTSGLSNLTLEYVFDGISLPLFMELDCQMMKTADIHGDGYADLVLLGEHGLEICQGRSNISQGIDGSDFTSLYKGNINDFSFLDLEKDGSCEVTVAGDEILLLNSTGDEVWNSPIKATRIFHDVSADPTYLVNTGRIAFLPGSDIDMRVISIQSPGFVDPGEIEDITVEIGNLGLNDVVHQILNITITSDDISYVYGDSLNFSLPSMDMDTFTFPWHVPDDEAVYYKIDVFLIKKGDREPADNTATESVTSKKHDIEIFTDSPHASGRGGEELKYSIVVKNNGTYEMENVSLSFGIPFDWDGNFSISDTPVEWIEVTDSVELVFTTVSPVETADGDFTLNLTANTATVFRWLNLTASILRPDLAVTEMVMYRSDGILTDDTIHGVVGDLMEIRILVANVGSTYSVQTTVAIRSNGSLLDDIPCISIFPGNSTWVSSRFRPQQGMFEFSAEVDVHDDNPEMNETNNNLSKKYIIKDQNPIGDYTLSGVIMDIDGEVVPNADVVFELGDIRIENRTDSNGTVIIVFEMSLYFDGMPLYINASDGKNLTSSEIRLFSEDGGRIVSLTLNHYIVEISGPSIPVSITIGSSLNIGLEITNKGNAEAWYVIMGSGVPLDWTIEFPQYPDGRIFLEEGGSVLIYMIINSSGNPLNSLGYSTYSLWVHTSAESYGEINDSWELEVIVEPYSKLEMDVIGDEYAEVTPLSHHQFILEVNNTGNVPLTFIPRQIAPAVINHWFNISYILLDVGETSRFTYRFLMPVIPNGSVLHIRIENSGLQSSFISLHILAQEYHSIDCNYSEEIGGQSGKSINIQILFTNNGNLEENVTITPYSNRTGIIMSGGSLVLGMGVKRYFDLEVVLPSDALAGDIIRLYVNVSTHDRPLINRTIIVRILESRGIQLQWKETEIIPFRDCTQYRHIIQVYNTGNGRNTFHFQVEGSNPGIVKIPEPITLDGFQTVMMDVLSIVPLNMSASTDNFLIPMDSTRKYDEFILRINRYSPDLQNTIEVTQQNGEYVYNISILNNGVRCEHLSLNLRLPSVNSYGDGDKQWDGSLNKAYVELMPGEYDHLQMRLSSPDDTKYWGADLYISITSISGRSIDDILLHKPPIPMLEAMTHDSITCEDTVVFTGTQSYWNILEFNWNFGDGTSETGVTVAHSFPYAGNYRISLIVVDDHNLTAEKSVIIHVENIEPAPFITAFPMNRTIEVGEIKILSGEHSIDRDGQIISYEWYLDDIYVVNWPVIQLSFDTAGDHEVTLNVKDNLGSTGNITVPIHVINGIEKGPTEQNNDDEHNEYDDMISYIPGVGILMACILGTVLIRRKRNFMKMIERKIAENQDSDLTGRK